MPSCVQSRIAWISRNGYRALRAPLANREPLSFDMQRLELKATVSRRGYLQSSDPLRTTAYCRSPSGSDASATEHWSAPVDEAEQAIGRCDPAAVEIADNACGAS